jgi:hypothetical protein
MFPPLRSNVFATTAPAGFAWPAGRADSTWSRRCKPTGSWCSQVRRSDGRSQPFGAPPCPASRTARPRSSRSLRSPRLPIDVDPWKRRGARAFGFRFWPERTVARREPSDIAREPDPTTSVVPLGGEVHSEAGCIGATRCRGHHRVADGEHFDGAGVSSSSWPTKPSDARGTVNGPTLRSTSTWMEGT